MNICEFCRLERVICPFSQLFINQIRSYLLDRCKIYYWAYFLLCVVFNFQYFRRYSEKTDFWPFLDIFSRAVTHSFIFRLTWCFVYRCRIFWWTFFVLWVLLNYQYLVICYIMTGRHLGFSSKWPTFFEDIDCVFG